VSEATFFNGKKKYSGMGVTDVRELLQPPSHFWRTGIEAEGDGVKLF